MILSGGKRLAVLSVAALVMAFVPGLQAAADSQCWSYRPAEKKFHKLTNVSRTAIGLRKLSLDPELSRVARKHTAEMLAKGELFHTPASVLGDRVTRWRRLGENVGRGPTVEDIQAAFLASEVHAENILRPGFRHVGFGTKKVDGVLWVTVIFESRKDPGTTLSMPKC